MAKKVIAIGDMAKAIEERKASENKTPSAEEKRFNFENDQVMQMVNHR